MLVESEVEYDVGDVMETVMNGLETIVEVMEVEDVEDVEDGSVEVIVID